MSEDFDPDWQTVDPGPEGFVFDIPDICRPKIDGREAVEWQVIDGPDGGQDLLARWRDGSGTRYKNLKFFRISTTWG